MVHFEIKDLSFYYPTEKKKPALSHINLKIERGQSQSAEKAAVARLHS